MPEKTLALTFDDGPSEATSELSEYLSSEAIRSTFFVNGANFVGLESVVDQTVADGHLLANHTQTHEALSTLTPEGMVKEVAETDALLAGRVPADKLFFRPPYGDWNDVVTKTLAASDMKKYAGPVGWDIGDSITESSAADWDCWDLEGQTRTVEECGDLYLKEIRLRKRGVVLLHDGPPGGDAPKTVAMIKYIVPILKGEGYKFARLDEVKLRTRTDSEAKRSAGERPPEGALPEETGEPDPCAK